MNKISKIILEIVVIIIAVLLVIFSPSKKSDADIIKIGYIGPFTGPVAATSGEDAGNGWKLAVSKRGTLSGKKVEVIYEDDACDPKKAVSAANKLLDVDHVDILVNGVCSGSMVSVAPIAESHKAILFTPVSTSPKITDAGDYVFRTSANAGQTGDAMSKFVIKSGYKNIAVLYENAEYSTGLKDAFIKSISSDPSVKILSNEGINSKDSDLRTPLVKISTVKPDAIVVIMNSTVTVKAFIKQAQDLGLKFPVVGNEYFAFSDVVTDPLSDGMYAAQYKYDNKASALVSYLEDYFKVYGKHPSQDIYAVLPYDGYNVLAGAIETCHGDKPECIKNALYEVKNYQGITGVITIDKNGDTEREFTIKQIKNKELVDAN